MGKRRLTADKLRKIGVKEVLIPGLLLAAGLGWAGWKKLGPDIYKNKQVFPESGIVRTVIDGDTFEFQNGIRVRMVGINAPTNDEKSTKRLEELIKNEKVWLEYDRYQDDKFGRILAWVWLDCKNPKFLSSEYMHLSFNRSREGLMENPEGCKDGKLVQEEMVREGLVNVELYKDRGELKYEKRIGVKSKDE